MGATLTIRNLDESIKQKLRVQAASHGRSMEAEVREILKKYRNQGGTRTSPLADFFIDAHAQMLDTPILTRHKNRYQAYFPGVPLVCP